MKNLATFIRGRDLQIIRGRDLQMHEGQALAPYLDLRDFHGALISTAPVTLDVIRDWINQPFKMAA